MFTAMEWKDLARACRSMAHFLEKAAENQRTTTIYPSLLVEVKRFKDFAERCELTARSCAAPDPSTPPSSGPPSLSLVSPPRDTPSP